MALSDKAVWRLVKQAARDAGLAGPEGYSGHSLRAGLATAADEAGADLAVARRRETWSRAPRVQPRHLQPQPRRRGLKLLDIAFAPAMPGQQLRRLGRWHS